MFTKSQVYYNIAKKIPRTFFQNIFNLIQNRISKSDRAETEKKRMYLLDSPCFGPESETVNRGRITTSQRAAGR